MREAAEAGATEATLGEGWTAPPPQTVALLTQWEVGFVRNMQAQRGPRTPAERTKVVELSHRIGFPLIHSAEAPDGVARCPSLSAIEAVKSDLGASALQFLRDVAGGRAQRFQQNRRTTFARAVTSPAGSPRRRSRRHPRAPSPNQTPLHTAAQLWGGRRHQRAAFHASPPRNRATTTYTPRDKAARPRATPRSRPEP